MNYLNRCYWFRSFDSYQYRCQRQPWRMRINRRWRQPCNSSILISIRWWKEIEITQIVHKHIQRIEFMYINVVMKTIKSRCQSSVQKMVHRLSGSKERDSTYRKQANNYPLEYFSLFLLIYDSENWILYCDTLNKSKDRVYLMIWKSQTKSVSMSLWSIDFSLLVL